MLSQDVKLNVKRLKTIKYNIKTINISRTVIFLIDTYFIKMALTFQSPYIRFN